MTSDGSVTNLTRSGRAGRISTTTAPSATYPDAFLNASPVLAQLIEHPLLSSISEELIGSGVTYYGGDGNYYSGDTSWHRDVFRIPDGEEAKTIVRHIKIAFYLDPLTAETGGASCHTGKSSSR